MDAEPGGRLDPDRRRPRREPRGDERVAGAAPAHVDLLRSRREPLDRRHRRLDRQLAQCSQHVVRGRLPVSGEAGVEPCLAEQLAPGALRRLPVEIRLVEQRREQGRNHLALARQSAVAVHVGAEPAAHERVEQGVRRTGVESQQRPGGITRQHRQVRDAPQVEDAAFDPGGREHGPVERRGQRRPLAAGRDVAAPEVGHRGDAGALGDDARIAELHRERRCATRRVIHRLSVAADRGHLAGADIRDAQEVQRRVRKDRPEPRVRVPEAYRGARRVLRQGMKLVLQILGNGRRVRRNGAGAAVIAERDQRGVHRVHAGSGDQADVERHFEGRLDAMLSRRSSRPLPRCRSGS